MADGAASWVSHMRDESLEALREGQRDGSIKRGARRPGHRPHDHHESLSDAYLWTVDPEEPYRRRIEQWRARTVQVLKP
jgi:hypothetical protein